MKAVAFVIIIAVTSVVLHATALPQALTVDEVLAKMELSNKNTPYMQAKIVTTVYNKLVDTFVETKSGKIWISHTGNMPRRIKIEYEKPFKEQLLVDNGKVTKYVPNTKNGIIFNFSKEDQPEGECIILGLCQSAARIKQYYTVKVSSKELVGTVNTTVVDLTPKEAKRAGLVKSIRLWLDSSKGYPIQTRVYTPNDNYRNSVFTEISTKSISGSVFDLKVPKEADIQTVKEFKF